MRMRTVQNLARAMTGMDLNDPLARSVMEMGVGTLESMMPPPPTLPASPISDDSDDSDGVFSDPPSETGP